MCYTREIVCPECKLIITRHGRVSCSKTACPENGIKVYLRYFPCPKCLTNPDLEPVKTAVPADLEPDAAFFRRARTTRGLPNTETRRRREKHLREVTGLEVRTRVLLSRTSMHSDGDHTVDSPIVDARVKDSVNVALSLIALRRTAH